LAWSKLIVAGISCDPPPLVSLCKRRVCLGMTSNSFFGLRQSWRRAQRGGHAKTSARLKHSVIFPLQVPAYLPDCPLIYSQSKGFLGQNNWVFSLPVRIKKSVNLSNIEQPVFVPQM
jgi:hypothetical protein